VLVWSGFWNIKIVGLLLRELIKFSLKGWQVKSGDLLVEDLWKLVD